MVEVYEKVSKLILLIELFLDGYIDGLSATDCIQKYIENNIFSEKDKLNSEIVNIAQDIWNSVEYYQPIKWILESDKTGEIYGEEKVKLLLKSNAEKLNQFIEDLENA